MAIAGRVAIVPKGDWSAETEYKRLDEVTYNNTMFIAKKAVPKGTLPTNAEYWSKSVVGSAVTVDDALSDTSTNPVQNKVVKNALDHKLNGYTVTYTVPANTGGWHKIAQISDYFNFDLYTNGGWFSAPKSTAHFQIQNIHGKIRIVQLSGKVLPNANNGIAKIRMVRVSDDVDTWILEEYSPSSINPEAYTFIMAGNLTLTPLDGSVDSTTSFKDSVSLDVIDITTGYVITTGSVDSAMSDTSEHPVQNKVIKSYVDKKASENVDFSTSTSKLLNGSIEAPMLVTNATRNLWKPIFQTTTQNGVTCTKNSDGTYTLNGTATDSKSFSISSGKMTFPEQFRNGLKFFDGSFTSDRGYAYVQFYNKDGGFIYELNHKANTPTSNVLSDAYTYIIGIYSKGGVPNVNQVIKPMLTTDLSATYDDFVPYDGYEIKSCGKNLLDPNAAGTYESPHTENGITFTKNNDGSWIINGTATANVGISVGNSGGDHTFIELEADAKAFLFGSSGVSGLAYGFYTNESKQISNNENIPKGTKIRNLWISCYKGNTFNNVKVLGVISYDLNLADTMYVPYQESTVQITPSTEFPLLGLKSFDGETNIISPANVEVTYAKSNSGAAIVDALKKSVSDGKTKVANAITGKGVKTATDATFDVMAENISKIDTELHGATLSVVTSDKELFGKTVTLTLKDGSTGSQRKTVFSSNGKCSFVVQKPGAYTVACGADANEGVTVTSDNVLNKTTMVVALVVLKIVTFANGTGAEIAKMIKAHYNNKINITDYWSVGDTRTVSLSSMVATTVGEPHIQQSVEFVIGGFDHDDLTNSINNHTKAAVTLLQKDCLMDTSTDYGTKNGSENTENGYMSSRRSNEGGWNSCGRRGWCNDTYFYALPRTFRELIKTVNKKTSVGNNSSTIETVQDKVFLASEIEIFGSTSYSFAGEGTQYQYYKNAIANRYKMPRWDGQNVSDIYLTRSPANNSTTGFCVVIANGAPNTNYANATAGIAPCVCL